jgi:hypothetical protein
MKERTKETLRRIGEKMNNGIGIGARIITPPLAVGGMVAGGMVGAFMGEPVVTSAAVAGFAGLCTGATAGLIIGALGGAMVGGLKAGYDELKERRKSKLVIGANKQLTKAAYHISVTDVSPYIGGDFTNYRMILRCPQTRERKLRRPTDRQKN